MHEVLHNTSERRCITSEGLEEGGAPIPSPRLTQKDTTVTVQNIPMSYKLKRFPNVFSFQQRLKLWYSTDSLRSVRLITQNETTQFENINVTFRNFPCTVSHNLTWTLKRIETHIGIKLFPDIRGWSSFYFTVCYKKVT